MKAGRKIQDLDIRMIKSLYNQGHSLDQIATYFNCAHTTVRSAMVRAGIERRIANKFPNPGPKGKHWERGPQPNSRPPRNPDSKLAYFKSRKYKETTCLGPDCQLPGRRFMSQDKKTNRLCPACKAEISTIETAFCY